MSRDRLLPAAFETVNPGGTPTVAHWTSIGVAAGFIISGTFNTVLALCAFFFVVNYTAVVPERVRAPAEGARYAEAVAGAGVSRSPPGWRWWARWRSSSARVVSDWGNSWKSLLLLALSYPVYRMAVGGAVARRSEASLVRDASLTPADAIHPRHRPAPRGHLRRRDHLVRPRPARPGARAGAARGLLPDPGAAGALAGPAPARSRVPRLHLRRGCRHRHQPGRDPHPSRCSHPSGRGGSARRGARPVVSPSWTRSPRRARWTAATCARRAITSSSALSQRTNAEGARSAGGVAGAARLRVERDRYPAHARHAAPQDRDLLAGRAAAAGRRRDRRARGVSRMGGGAGAARARSTRPTASGSTMRCWSRRGFPKTAALLRRAGLRGRAAGDVGVPEDGRRAELSVGAMVSARGPASRPGPAHRTVVPPPTARTRAGCRSAHRGSSRSPS